MNALAWSLRETLLSLRELGELMAKNARGSQKIMVTLLDKAWRLLAGLTLLGLLLSAVTGRFHKGSFDAPWIVWVTGGVGLSFAAWYSVRSVLKCRREWEQSKANGFSSTTDLSLVVLMLGYEIFFAAVVAWLLIDLKISGVAIALFAAMVGCLVATLALDSFRARN